MSLGSLDVITLIFQVGDATLDTLHMVLPWQSCSQAFKYSIAPDILVR